MRRTAKKSEGSSPGHSHEHDVDHGHAHSQSNSRSHSHSHSVFSSHTHGTDSAEKIMKAFQGAGDRGSQITLIGLFANIGLTAIKGVAGYLTHSAVLVADAGHSLSGALAAPTSEVRPNLLQIYSGMASLSSAGDFHARHATFAIHITASCAHFETLGTTTVSLFLIGGALGIGFHSYHLLLQSLTETASTLPAGPLQELLANVTSAAPAASQDSHLHAHAHSHSHGVDPNALWFAALGIVSKEWLYRITKRVADEENSPVLLANAIHHRTDVYGSLVAFFAILGSWWWPALPLDPIASMLVALVIMRQGAGLLYGAWGDLTDANIPLEKRETMRRTLDPLLASSASSVSIPSLLAVRHLHGRSAGSLVYVNLTAEVPRSISVFDASQLEDKIVATLKEGRREIADVRIKFNPVG
ncbi:unnamed protein product [Mycena citricolor]|uniref:Cation efflux protein transmembrane domain-containing protein n=1 Tax=Mycena citricolor TaxID=2018698 RepID=A0AAD2Q6I6_9AGAR|nr:unnamed protein product [Mycena citricolor]